MPYKIKDGKLDGALLPGNPALSKDPSVQVDLKESMHGGEFKDMGGGWPRSDSPEKVWVTGGPGLTLPTKSGWADSSSKCNNWNCS